MKKERGKRWWKYSGGNQEEFPAEKNFS